MCAQQNNNSQIDLIYDETNVSETNWLKDVVEIAVKIISTLALIYVFVYLFLEILILSLNIDKQILLENMLTNLINEPKNIATIEDTERFNKIKSNVLSVDYNFPQTSKLNIYVIDDLRKNALCLPNGNIYITSSLYKELESDEMLTFVIAHEMAHYKNKDHLRNIKHKISKTVVLVFLSIAAPSEHAVSSIAEGSMTMNKLSFSRNYEKKADIYAGKILLKLYGNTQAGTNVLNLLRANRYPAIFGLFSTHPDIDNRIKTLNNLK